MPANIQKKSFLFLQGPASPFFKKLQKELSTLGHDTNRINFNGGDLLFSFCCPNNHNYINKPDEFGSFLATLFADKHVTDICLFGDCRPLHRQAIELAKHCNITIHVFEEGYLRPYWFTLEANGTNANSHLYSTKNAKIFEKDTREITRAMREKLLKPVQNSATNTQSKSLLRRATYDIAYNVANFLLSPVFPYYQSHRIYSAFQEYRGWSKRLFLNKFVTTRKDTKQIEALIRSNVKFYLLPLQLNADSQVQHHSSYHSISAFITETLSSFAKHADSESHLVIKNHPLDTGLVDYKQLINETCESLNINKSRIQYLETGHLEQLLRSTTGVVLINSTVGITALKENCKVIALGKVIYNIENLCYSGSVDNFWESSFSPNEQLFNDFNLYLLNKTQILGNIYEQPGIDIGIKNTLAKRLLNDKNY